MVRGTERHPNSCKFLLFSKRFLICVAVLRVATRTGWSGCFSVVSAPSSLAFISCVDVGVGPKMFLNEVWKQIYPKNSAYHQGASFLRRPQTVFRAFGTPLRASVWVLGGGLLLIFWFLKRSSHDCGLLVFYGFMTSFTCCSCSAFIHPPAHPVWILYTCSILPHPQLSPSRVC